MEPSACFPFWDQLMPVQQSMLQNGVKTRNFPKNHVVYESAGVCTGLVVVETGRLRVYTVSEEGKELTLYRLQHGDICLFAASCMLIGVQFSLFVTAETDVTALVIPPDVYRKLMDESAAVANFTNALMGTRFSDVMFLMDQILSKKLDARLSAFLLEERQLCGSDTLRLTHEQIAGHLGSLREVITRMLKYFQEEGLVRLERGTVHLTDLRGLIALSGKVLPPS